MILLHNLSVSILIVMVRRVQQLIRLFLLVEVGMILTMELTLLSYKEVRLKMDLEMLLLLVV